MASLRSVRTTTIMPAPAHPVPQLQGPFEESMMESANDLVDNEANLDSITRRTILLERPQYERVVAGRWKQKPGERYHPLWKVVSQISFGLHLLAEGMARSEEQVMKILQTHVDDIDCFLERTTEDLELAYSDVSERLHYLKLPLQHAEVFDRMLEDRTFRTSIVDGNEKIEHIVQRTSEATKDALKDVQKGLDATKALGRYLTELNRSWERQTPEHEAVFVAMLGNVEGWGRAFMDLHLQGNKLVKSLIQLLEITTEMQRRAGIVSRKYATRSQPAQRSPGVTVQPRHASTGNRIYRGSDIRKPTGEFAQSMTQPHKPLPADPQHRSSRQDVQRVRSGDPLGAATSNGISENGSSGGRKSRRSAHKSPPQSTSTRPDVGSEVLTAARFDSSNEVVQATPTQEHAKSKNQTRIHDVPAIELPGDVPQEALLQAPISKNSRMSLHLGVKPRDTADGKAIHRLSNLGLGALLKSPTQHVVATPGSAISGATEASYATALTSDPDGEMSYFAAPDAHMAGSRAILDPIEDVRKPPLDRDSSLLSPVTKSPAISSPRIPRSPAFTSHPPDMEMAAAPSASAGNVQKLVNHARRESANDAGLDEDYRSDDLGEPGPEIEGPEAACEPGVAAISHPDSDKPPDTTMTPTAVALPLEPSPRNLEAAVVHIATPKSVQDENDGPIVAELEGITPLAIKAGSAGPIELEAPRHHFSLPPRSRALAEAANSMTDAASATITSRDDFFKMPPASIGASAMDSAQGTVMPATSHAPIPSLEQKERASRERDDRTRLPSRLQIPRKEAPRKSKLRTSVIDQLSFTPPGSPIHARPVSEVSDNSAQLNGEHRSRVYSPTEEAPPPPAPGGRRMVSVDYASAAQFDGERKSRHNSTGSMTGFKRLLSTSRADGQMGRPNVDMMTVGGKDVVWFKGMSSNGVWVS